MRLLQVTWLLNINNKAEKLWAYTIWKSQGSDWVVLMHVSGGMYGDVELNHLQQKSIMSSCVFFSINNWTLLGCFSHVQLKFMPAVERLVLILEQPASGDDHSCGGTGCLDLELGDEVAGVSGRCRWATFDRQPSAAQWSLWVILKGEKKETFHSAGRASAQKHYSVMVECHIPSARLHWFLAGFVSGV